MKTGKIGLCHGVFDVVHAGHIHHLKTAKEHVDYLIVSITDSPGTCRLFKNFEFIIEPEPVYASFVTTKSSFSSEGFTTVLISKLYFFAKSKSL